MSVLIKFFKDPTGEPELISADSVGEWLLNQYGQTGIPDELRIFKGHCSEATDISGNLTELISTEGEYEACMMPGTPVQIVWALVVVVVALVVVLATIKPPSMNNRQQGSSTNALSNRSNQPRPNQRIVDIRGKVAGHMPDQLMVPYKIFENNIETEYSFMCVGVGVYDVTDVKDGDTYVRDIDGSGAAFYRPDNVPGYGTSYLNIGNPPSGGIWNISRSNEIDGVTLSPYNAGIMPGVPIFPQPDRSLVADVSETSFSFEQVATIGGRVNVTFTYLTYVGDFSVLVNGVSVVRAIYTQSQVLGNYLITGVSIDRIALDASNWPTNGTDWLGGQPATSDDWTVVVTRPDTTTFVGVLRNEKPDGPTGRLSNPSCDFSNSGVSLHEAIAVIPNNTEEIWLNLVALNGIYKENNDATYNDPIVMRVTIVQTLNGVETGVATVSTHSMLGYQKDQVGLTIKLTMPYAQGVVKVLRQTPKDEQFDGNVVDEIKWRDFYRATKNTQATFGNVTTVHTVRRATQGAMTSREAKFNATVIRDNEQYFAQVVHGMALDPLFGRLTSDQVDFESLYGVQEQILSYFNNPDSVRVGYAFDDSSISFEESVSMICDAVNVVAYRMGGVLKFRFERPQSESNMQFTHRSKWPDSDSRSRLFKNEKEYDGVELTYRDHLTAADLTISLPDQFSINPKRIELNGCITTFGATIRARREYNKLRYSRIAHSFDSFGIARTLLPGMRIDVANGTIGPYQDGEILDQQGLVVRLSQPVTFQTGMSHSLVLSKRDGGIEGISVTPVTNDPYRVVLSRPPMEDLFIGYNQSKTQYNFGSDETLSSQAMLVQSVEPNITDGEEKITVKCMNYDPRYYDGDKQPV